MRSGVPRRGAQRWTGAVVAAVAAALVTTAGCRRANLSLPPPKTPRATQPRPTVPDPMPLPADAPDRPVFPPLTLADRERGAGAIRDECFTTAETLLALAPGDPAGWILLGVVHARFGDDAGATACWERALALDSRQVTPHRHLGDAAVRRGDPEAAVRHYRDAVVIDPDALAVVDRLAATLVDLGDLAAANELLASFVVGRPEIAEGWCLLGRVRLLMGKAEGARNAFRRALEIEPSSPDAIAGIAESMRAEAGLPTDLAITRRLADRQGPARGSRRIDEIPELPLERWAGTVHFWAGDAFARLGDGARAAICWRRAIELDPQDGESREALALHLENGGRTRDAMRVRQAWCDAEPDNPSAWFGKGKLALALGLPADAAEALERAVVLAPDRAESRALLAQALATSDPAGSLAAARRAAELDPTPGHLILLAETLARLGEQASAEAAAERALALDADDPRARALVERLRLSARRGRGGEPRD